MILEIGSGTGRVTLPLAAHAKQVVATDSSLNMVMKLREEQKAKGNKHRLTRL